MNKCMFSGFISSDIKMDDIKLKDGNTMKKARFSIACQKKTRQGGADFVNVVALGDMAETINKWFSKGKGIYVECRVSTGSYTNKEGKKIFTEEKLIESWEFPPIRKDEQAVDNSEPQPTANPQSNEQPSAPDESFMDIPDDITDDLPFR